MKQKYINFLLLSMGCLILFSESEGASVFPWEIPEISQKRECKADLFIPCQANEIAHRDQESKEKIENDSWLLDDTDFLAFCLGFYDPFSTEGTEQSLSLIYTASGFNTSLLNFSDEIKESTQLSKNSNLSSNSAIEEERFEYLLESFTFSEDSEHLKGNKDESAENISLAEEIQIFEKDDVSNFLLTQNLVNELPIENPIAQIEEEKGDKIDEQVISIVTEDAKEDKSAASIENSFTDCSAMFKSDEETKEPENKIISSSFEEKNDKEGDLSLFKENESNADGEISKRKIDFEDLEPEVIETVSLSLGPQQHENTRFFFYVIGTENSVKNLAFFEVPLQGIIDGDEPLFVEIAQEHQMKINSFLPLSELLVKKNQVEPNLYIPQHIEKLKSNVVTAKLQQDDTKDSSTEADLSALEERSSKVEENEDFFGSDNQEESSLLESIFKKSEKPEPPKAPPVMDKLSPSLWEKDEGPEEVKVEVYRAEGL